MRQFYYLSRHQTLLLPDENRFLSWLALLKSTSCVLEAVDKFKRSQNLSDKLAYIDRTEILWLKNVQENSFGREINSLKKGKNIDKNSKLISLSPLLNYNQVLRVNGRVKNFPNSNENFKSFILNAKDYVSQLIIKYYHEKFFHASHETVINELRQKYWLLGIRKVLRSIINKCIICRMSRGRPQNPQIAALPPARLAYNRRPF